MNFADVKTLVINGEEIKKITDDLGRVLWSKPDEHEWHTVWTGSLIHSTAAGQVDDPGGTPITLDHVIESGKIRVYIKCDATSYDRVQQLYFTDTEGHSHEWYSLPATITTTDYVLVINGVNEGSFNQLWLHLDNGSNTISSDIVNKSSSSGNVSITITKVEQYY